MSRCAPDMPRSRILTLVLLLAGAAWAGMPLTDEEQAAVRDAEARRIAVIDRVDDTVVAIYGEDPAQGGGSGVVFDAAGLVLTNFHVVKAAGREGWAGLADGKLYRWRLVGLDPGGDLAVIQLRGRDAFAHAPLGDSASVRVGDLVMAMGNPFALADDQTPTITLGIVSGVNRFQQGAGREKDLLVYGKCIQVDSSINPGNSGGPLFDMAGRVIGINGRGSFEERGRVNVGLGYAISSEQIKNFIPVLLTTRVAQHGTLDAVFADRGGRVVCTEIDYDHCPLVPHGFDLGDELVGFNGQPIATANAFLNELLTLPAGWTVEVAWRHDGQTRQRRVTLNALPYSEAPDARPRVRLPVPGGTPPTPRPGPDGGDEAPAPRRPGFSPIQVDLPEGVPGQLQNLTINRDIAELLLGRWRDADRPTDDAVLADLRQALADLAALQDVRLSEDRRGFRITGSDAEGRPFALALEPADANRPTQDPIARAATYGERSARRPQPQPDAPADRSATPAAFRDVADRAQPRMVKLYGAGIGREAGYATGLIVSPHGHILTAQGVYLASSRLRVVTADGTIHFAEVLRRNDDLQLALLKIDADTPDFFALADEANVKPGDWVLAVSNAFKVAEGIEPLSVNLGIVSLRAQLDTKKRAADFDVAGEVLLIDAITSNPGAAVGALVGLDGELVGMIGKVLEAEATNTRLNYAVPVDLLAAFVAGRTLVTDTGDERLAPDGEPDLGIRLFTLSGRRAPAYIDAVAPDSPAAAAGLKKDDLILAIDDAWVQNVRDYEQIFRDLKPGQRITLSVKRGQEIMIVGLVVGVAK